MNNTVLTPQTIAFIDWHILRISYLSGEIYLLSINRESNDHCIAEYDEHIISLRKFGLCKGMQTFQEMKDNLIID